MKENCTKAGKKEADCKTGWRAKKLEADAGVNLPANVSGTDG